MAEHIPHFTPGASVTYDASADVTGGQLVEITGNRTVGPAAAVSKKFVGVAAFDAKAGEKVTVQSGGVHELTAPAAIAAGDLVVAAAAGAVATAGATPAVGTVVGTALAAAASNVVLVKLAR